MTGLMRFTSNGLNELLEEGAAAYADAVEACAFEHEVVWVGVAFTAGEDAYECDFAAPADAFEGARESTDAAVFNDAIDAAAAGERENLFLPVGMRFVIHAVGCAE